MKIGAVALIFLATSLLTVGCQKFENRTIQDVAAPVPTASGDSEETKADPEVEAENYSTPVVESSNTELYLRDLKKLTLQINDRTTLSKVLHKIKDQTSEKIHYALGAGGAVLSAEAIPQAIENLELVCVLHSQQIQLPAAGDRLISQKITEKYARTNANTFLRQTVMTFQAEKQTFILQCQRKGFAKLIDLKNTLGDLATVSGK